jgi:predicted RNase H-like HicB family nuclease
MMLMLTAVFRKVPEGYVAFTEELPGANAQGATLEEARASLKEAVELVVEANRSSFRALKRSLLSVEELVSSHVELPRVKP